MSQPHASLCPTDAELEMAIAGNLSAEQMNSIEVHLTDCARCRAHLEKRSHVAVIEELARDSQMADKFESPRLRTAMERLLVESRVLVEAQWLRDPGRFDARSAHDLLPPLQPSAKAGFLGRLGDIDIRRVLGRGGMGVVFEGFDNSLNRTVAVKMLSPHLGNDDAAKHRFLREAQAAAALKHANIVSIHAIGEADGMPYLVQQFVDGESLAERLRQSGKLSLEEVVRLGIETARGLATAHASGLIHRDIKPANILLEYSSGNALIADFGLAKRVDSDTLTELGSVAGTPAYMSPEQTISLELDGRSDLFSLGVVLYEASTGVSPFAGDSPFVTLSRIRQYEPQSVCVVNPELPKWFGAIVERLLAKEPTDRFPSAQSLIQALESQSEPGIRKLLSGNRSQIAGVGLSIAATVALLASLWWVSSMWLSGSQLGNSRSAGGNTLSDTLVASPPDVLEGFVVDHASQPCLTLAEALDTAHDNSVIEVHGDGPFATEGLSIRGKRLTIRAADGFVPRFVPNSPDTKNLASFIFSESDLVLEGLEILWPMESALTKFEDTGERCVIAVGGGELSLQRCRVVAGRLGCCLGARGKEIRIRNCHLVSTSGTCIAWPAASTNVTVEHCLLESRTALFTKVGPTTLPIALRFAYNTVVSERLLTIISNNQNRRPFRFMASHNIFDTQVLVAMVALGGFPSNPSGKMVGALREAVGWQDESNLYRRGTLYLAANPRNQPLNTLPSALDSLDKWLAFWNQPASKSIEGTIQFEPRDSQSEYALLRLKGITDPTGPIPPDLGGNPGRFGPGKTSGL